MNYQEGLERLQADRPNLAQMAYNYQGTDLYQTFEQFATFCTTNLETFEQEHNLPSIAFCYHVENTVDGRAGHSFGMPYIFLNRGIVDIMNQFFVNHETAFIYPEFNEYRAMRQQLDLPLGYLLFQLTSLFAFYHERTHIQQMKEEIIQWQAFDEGSKSVTELYAFNAQHAEYDRLGHAMEFDADVRAAQLCAYHVLQVDAIVKKKGGIKWKNCHRKRLRKCSGKVEWIYQWPRLQLSLNFFGSCRIS